jgi:ferredoxin/flavodoxin---NADP+ reductase
LSTDLLNDCRSILGDAPQYDAVLVRREDHTSDLARFFIRAVGSPRLFDPGQYMTLGVFADERLVQRPYSVVSTVAQAATSAYEFYIRRVPTLGLTSLLWRLPPGHPLRMFGPKGRFVLDADDPRTRLFIATGTGVAPFVSMIRTALAAGMPRRTVLIHGCSLADELAYGLELEAMSRDPTSLLEYIPTVSRPSDLRSSGWAGPRGRVESVLDNLFGAATLRPASTVAYLCGNPEMVESVRRILITRGFPESEVRSELYGPKAQPVGVRPLDPARP